MVAEKGEHQVLPKCISMAFLWPKRIFVCTTQNEMWTIRRTVRGGHLHCVRFFNENMMLGSFVWFVITLMSALLVPEHFWELLGIATKKFFLPAQSPCRIYCFEYDYTVCGLVLVRCSVCSSPPIAKQTRNRTGWSWSVPSAYDFMFASLYSADFGDAELWGTESTHCTRNGPPRVLQRITCGWMTKNSDGTLHFPCKLQSCFRNAANRSAFSQLKASSSLAFVQPLSGSILGGYVTPTFRSGHKNAVAHKLVIKPPADGKCLLFN